jgi:hypothetical protein
MHYVASDDFCKVKTVYSISVNFSEFEFRFILVTLYKSDLNRTGLNTELVES